MEAKTWNDPADDEQVALEAIGLYKAFNVRAKSLLEKPKTVSAVSDVSFRLKEGQTLGIVGESGCGKSTTARLLMHLISKDSGEIRFRGATVEKDSASLKAYRRQVQMVFQDSSASLNPRLTVEQSIMFGPLVHGKSRQKAQSKTESLLTRVGLEPAQFARRYPHEISGGQRQRVNIARALALDPQIVIFDEAVSALDKSIEAQVLNLLQELKQDLGLSYIFISHDLNVVRYISDEVIVMYLGRIVEQGSVMRVYENPGHPYTQALLASMPSIDPLKKTLESPISGDPPSPIDLPPGCSFAPRCPHVAPVCERVSPLSSCLQEDHHVVACHLSDPDSEHPKVKPVLL